MNFNTQRTRLVTCLKQVGMNLLIVFFASTCQKLPHSPRVFFFRMSYMEPFFW